MTILLDDEQIAARWGAHPTTGNVSVYRSIAHAQARAILTDIKNMTLMELNANKLPYYIVPKSYIAQLEAELEGK